LTLVPEGSDVTIVHDYEGVGAWMEGRWKTKDPVVAEIVTACRAVISQRRLLVSFRHQRGHQASWAGRDDFAHYNSRADAWPPRPGTGSGEAIIEPMPDVIDQALALARRGSFAEAERLLQAAVDAVPDDIRARLELALVLRRLRRTKDAEAMLREAVRRAPDHTAARSSSAASCSSRRASRRRRPSSAKRSRSDRISPVRT
jgi:tetratricopeptide (TPR) repeat protein